MLLSEYVKSNATNIIGKKVKLLKEYGIPGFKIGDTRIIDINANYNGSSSSLFKANPGNYFNYCDLELCPLTIEELNATKVANIARIADIVAANTKIDQQIAFITDNNLTEYDEDLFKVTQVLKQLEIDGLSILDRAKAIASIIK